MDNRRSETGGILTQDGSAGRSLSDVMVGIVSSVQDIVRSEIQLAKVEISEIVERTRNAGVMLATGGILGLFGLGFLLLTAMFALEIVLPNWAAALIMGVLLMLGAAVGIGRGRQRMKDVNPPRKTIETVKETFEWMKEQPRS